MGQAELLHHRLHPPLLLHQRYPHRQAHSRTVRKPTGGRCGKSRGYRGLGRLTSYKGVWKGVSEPPSPSRAGLREKKRGEGVVSPTPVGVEKRGVPIPSLRQIPVAKHRSKLFYMKNFFSTFRTLFPLMQNVRRREGETTFQTWSLKTYFRVTDKTL